MTYYELARRNARAHLATVRNRRGIRRAVTEEDIDRHLWRLAEANRLFPREIMIDLQEDIRRRTAPSLTVVSAETDNEKGT